MPRHDPAPLQSPLSASLLLEHPGIKAPFSPAAPTWTSFPSNQAVLQHFVQRLQHRLQLTHPKLAGFHPVAVLPSVNTAAK